jgi:hypothetical protein
MAEEKSEKKLFDAVKEFYDQDSRTDEEFREDFPRLHALLNSASTDDDRRKRFDLLLGDPALQRELRDIDEFAKIDFSGYKEPTEEAYKPGNLANASMKDVKAFYDRAKRVIDPQGKLGKTELYETAGPRTFELLEEKIGPDYEGDWFGNLLEEFGYPDTPEGMEQLTQDFQAALTRTKNSKFGDKFGKAKAPLKFLFGNTFDVLEDGKKPTLGDVLVDTGANVAMAIPGSEMLPLLGRAVSMAPKSARAAEIVAKADAPKTILGKMLKNTATAAAVPTGTQAADYAFGTDTEKEKREGLAGRGVAAGTGTFINMATPFMLGMVPGRILATTGNAGLNNKDAQVVRESFGDLLLKGGRVNAAKERLKGLAEDAMERRDVALEFAKKLSGKNNATTDELGKIAGGFNRRLELPALNLARTIDSKGGNVYAGIEEFLNSGTDRILELQLRTIANQPTNMLSAAMPYLSAYTVNRLGTGAVADYGKRMLGRYTNRFIEEEPEE